MGWQAAPTYDPGMSGVRLQHEVGAVEYVIAGTVALAALIIVVAIGAVFWFVLALADEVRERRAQAIMIPR